MRQVFISFFKAFRDLATETKILIQRSMSYIAVLNSGMILFLMVSKLESYGININLTKWFLPLFIFTICAMVFVGFVDTKLGFFAEEKKLLHKKDPYQREMINRLRRIEERLSRKF